MVAPICIVGAPPWGINLLAGKRQHRIGVSRGASFSEHRCQMWDRSLDDRPLNSQDRGSPTAKNLGDFRYAEITLEKSKYAQ